MSSARILVADGDRHTLDTLPTILRDAGFEVTAVDGRLALFEKLGEWTPDLLVLDAMVPGSNGVHVLQELKADPRWREIPVVMVSSLSPDEMTERTFGLGAADFVRKPFRPGELVARIQAQLRLHRLLVSTQRALKSAEEELQRARDESETRRKVVDILHDVAGDLSSDEIYHVLARRVARTLHLSRCSVILAKPGDEVGVVAAAFDTPALRDFKIRLELYPEIRRALETGKPVLVEDLQRDTLFAEVRVVWLHASFQLSAAGEELYLDNYI